MSNDQHYPREVAQEVSIRRPDLSGGDAIATVLTADPSLTAAEVIDLLDDAADEHRYQRMLDSAEPFDGWPQAVDAAVERDRPILARVDREVGKCFPSRQVQRVYLDD